MDKSPKLNRKKYSKQLYSVKIKKKPNLIYFKT